MSLNSKVPGLTAEELKLTTNCFPPNTKIKIFGSRAKGDFRSTSDLDICIISDIDRAKITETEERLEESDLLFTVDIIKYSDCAEEFQKHIVESGIDIIT